MALNVTIFPRMQLRQGQFPPVLPLGPDVVSFVVALGGTSPSIPAGACVRLLADEDVRVTWGVDAGIGAPAADGFKLKANIAERYELPEGGNPYYLRVAAG